MKKPHLLLALALAATTAHAQIPLQQSTASQAVKFGPFVDSTDGNTEKTALTIANTDIKCSKNGGTLASKNSGGGTHDANGWYTVTFDATDTNTAGRFTCFVHVSGALPVFREFMVYPTSNYAAVYSTAPGASGGLFIAGTNAATTVTTAFTSTFTGNLTGNVGGNVTGSIGSVASGGLTEASFATTTGSFIPLGITRQGTAQAATSSTVTLDAGAGFGDNTIIGQTLNVFGSTNGNYWQSCGISAYVASTKVATLQNCPSGFVTPTGTITYKLSGTSSASAGGGLDASGVRAAVGLASANLDTQLAALQSDTDNIQTRIPTSLVSGRMDASVGAYQTGMTPLQPATAGRTLVVDAAGLADANVVKVGPTGSGTAQTAKDIGAAVPSAAAGASGGLLISGSNAGTTTLAALTVTGTTTMSDGLVVNRSTTNASAIVATGNGTGNGATFTSGSGATGNGAQFTAASTNGNGMGLTATGTGVAMTVHPVNVTQFGGTNGTFTSGVPAVNTTQLNGTSQTGRDIGASVLLSPGTSTGQLSLSSGAVLLQATQTGVTIPNVTTVANLTNAPTAGDFTSTMKTSIGTAVTASAVASVTAGVTVSTNNDKTGYTLSNAGIDAFADRNTTGHTTAGTWGGAWNAAGASGDPWSTAIPGSYASGSAGYVLGNLSVGSPPSAATIATAVWGNGTRTLSAGTNIVLAKGTGVTGFTDLDAAAVRVAVGLASANLDTQIGTLATGTNLAAVNTKLGTPAGASVSADIAALNTATTAAAIRTALGLSSANLDTQLASAIADSTGITSLLARLTSTRAGYIDNLSAGAVATAASISSLHNLSTSDIQGIVIEPNNNITLKCVLAADLAYVGGDVTTSGSSSTYKDPSGTSTRITGTVSTPGNRNASVTCPP